ncbi:glycosyltransferase family 4 protein [Mucilaginibacter koreensis]
MGSYFKESTEINAAFNCTYVNLSTSDSVESVGKNSVKKYIALLKIVSKVMGLLIRNKYDFCYMTPSARTPAFYKDFVIISILKLFGMKMLYHFHNRGVADCAKGKLAAGVYKSAFKNSKVILISELLFKDVAGFVPRNDVHILWCGIPVTPLAATEHFKFEKVSTGRCKILFVSNMIVEKGVYVLLNACEILQQKGLDFECHFIGDWFNITEDTFGKEIEQRGLAGRIFAHGKQYGEQKFKHFQDADIFAFPTYYENETFGLVNLEAMQFALPVISTPVGGIPDIIRDNKTGFIVPCNDAAAVAGKLELLIANPELRKRLGHAGRERFFKDFTIGTYEHRLTNILTEVSQL